MQDRRKHEHSILCPRIKLSLEPSIPIANINSRINLDLMTVVRLPCTFHIVIEQHFTEDIFYVRLFL